jgi:hypothetical protein
MMTPFRSKGQWIVRNGDTFVGMTSKGVESMSKIQWCKHLYDGVQAEAKKPGLQQYSCVVDVISTMLQNKEIGFWLISADGTGGSEMETVMWDQMTCVDS